MEHTKSPPHTSANNNGPLPGTVGALIWHYLQDYKLYIVIFFITALWWAIDVSLRPYILKLIIDGAAAPPGQESYLALLLWPSVAYVLMSILLNINMRIYNYAWLRLAPALRSRVTRDMFSYLLKHSYSYFQHHSAGSILQKLNNVENNLDKVIYIPNENFYPQLFALLISCGTLYFAVHPIFGAIILVWSILFVGLSYRAAQRLIRYSTVFSSAKTRLSGTLTDSISNCMTTKLFANNTYELAYINKDITNVVDSYRTLRWQSLWLNFYQSLGMSAFVASMLAALIYGRTHGWVTPGDFAFVLSLAISFFWSIYNIGRSMNEFAQVVGFCNQGLSIVRTPHGIVDAPGAIPITITDGNISFDKVTFGYEEHTPLFDQLSITIPAGQRIGLVGHSGGGKSTFIRLILRLMEPQDGVISIDNQDISQVTQHSLRKQIATIPQEPALFNRSVMENIRFARTNATDEEVIEAAKQAQCHEFIISLPKGYQTRVGDQGSKLSGGQRQRIAIARAFLDKTPILLLDEATSALDSETELAIQESLKKVMRNRTTVVIAHRLSTLKDMDRIIVFERGKIVQDGTLYELLNNQSGPFYKLWHMQAQGFLPDEDEACTIC